MWHPQKTVTRGCKAAADSEGGRCGSSSRQRGGAVWQQQHAETRSGAEASGSKRGGGSTSMQ